MNEATIERVAKHLAASNGDPAAWGAYAHLAMEVVALIFMGCGLVPFWNSDESVQERPKSSPPEPWF